MESHFIEKQIQIIIAAEQLFSEHGFSGTSVRDIAALAKVNIAMISYYFGSKEKLLEAIFEYRIGTTTIQLEHLLANKEIDPLDKINILVDHYVEKMINNTCFFKIMQNAQFASHENKDLYEIIYKSKKKNFDLISALIAEGQKSGQFRKSIDVGMMVSTLVGAANQIYNGRNYYKKLNSLEEMEEEKFHALLNKRMKLYLKNMFKATLTYEL